MSIPKLVLRILSVVALVSVTVYMSCSSNDEPKPIDCASAGLQITITNQNSPSSCTANNGSITVSASGGASPYQFKLDNGTFVNTAIFANLGGGSFTVTVKDKNGCEKLSSSIGLTAPSGPVAGSPTIINQTDCLNPNGSITANVTGGTPPYQYKIGTGAFSSAAQFTGLNAGNYSITIKDNADCSITVNSTVVSATNVSYATQIKSILELNCIKSGCHNGGNTLPNWSNLSTVQANAQNIKTRTGNKSMPQDIAPTGLPEDQIKLIACWVNEGAKNN